jgi:hypothetical protein
LTGIISSSESDSNVIPLDLGTVFLVGAGFLLDVTLNESSSDKSIASSSEFAYLENNCRL